MREWGRGHGLAGLGWAAGQGVAQSGQRHCWAEAQTQREKEEEPVEMLMSAPVAPALWLVPMTMKDP